MYIIIGTSRYGTEQIDEAATLREAQYLVNEYRLAYGSDWRVYYRRKRKSDDD